MKTKTVLITGCSSGFGLEMVSCFLKSGWTVIATLRNASERQSIFAELKRQYSLRLKIENLDVTSEEDRASSVQLITKEFGGKLDCLINNAGYGLFGSLEDISEKQLREQMEVNFFGTALLTRALLPALRTAKGKVFNLSSVFGFTGFPLTSAYCASKFAIEGLTESLRFELAPHGIQVSLVEPGGHRTRFAEQVMWGESSFSNSSAYLIPTRGYSSFKEKLANAPNPARPHSVAKIVVKLAEKNHIPARVVCGKDAAFMSFLRHRPLGFRVGEFLVSFIYQKRFFKEGQHQGKLS